MSRPRPGSTISAFAPEAARTSTLVYGLLQESAPTSCGAGGGALGAGLLLALVPRPGGIRLELNHVPGKGLLEDDAPFLPDPSHPMSG